MNGKASKIIPTNQSSKILPSSLYHNYTPSLLPLVLSESKLPSVTSPSKQSPLITKTRLHRKESEETMKKESKKSREYEEQMRSIYLSACESLRMDKEKRKNFRIQIYETKQKIEQTEKSLIDLIKQTKKKEKDASKKILRTQEDLMLYNRKKTQLKSELERETLEANQNIRVWQDLLETSLAELEVLDQRVKRQKQQLKASRTLQIEHFFKLLKHGKDTRTDGLSWVVRVLWELGEEVNKQDFPDFLDTQSVNSILLIAKNLNEKEKLCRSLVRCGSSKEHRKVQSCRDLLKEVKQRLKVSTFHTRNEKHEVHGDYEKALYIRNQINTIDEKLRNTKEREMERITSEFTLHQYEKKYGVTIKDMISAVLGIEFTLKNLTTINRIKNKLERQIASIKTFTFGGNNKFHT